MGESTKIMFQTFAEYQEARKALSFDEMNRLHLEILEEVRGDEDAEELYEELITTAIRYAHIRAEWAVWDREKRQKEDQGRTYCHNSLIVKCNQLSRYLKMQGKAAAWRDRLGYEEDDPHNRKTVGDFGCFLAFVNGINSR